MIVALQQAQSRVAEIRGALPADTELTVERLTPAAFPIFSLNLTGGLPAADLHDYAFYVMRPALSRVPGVGRVEVLSSDTREIEVIVDPGKLRAAGLTVDDVVGGAEERQPLPPVGRYPRPACSTSCSPPACGNRWTTSGARPSWSRTARRSACRDVATVEPGAPDRTSLIVGQGGNATLDQRLAADRRQHPRRAARPRRRRCSS